MNIYRTHNCGELRKENINETVRLSGWVHRKRDHGGLLFIDLRDHFGLTQLVIEPESPFFADVENVRAESVIRIAGTVIARDGEAMNSNLPTGEIEIRLDEYELLSAAGDLPLPVFGEPDYPEDIRLRYRFLDLRRETIHKNIVLRSQIISSLRQRMIEQGFTEYQTPILTASSPEGARDFLVPSRMHPGSFYALPQAPQQFKQLLMVAGFDRYFQIAPCFRDEDARADRSPGEFYQLDIEMSFVTQEDVFNAVEPVLHDIFVEFGNGKRVTETFPRIPYAEAMRKYGSDKPDLRIPIEMASVTDAFRGSDFKIFANMIEKDDRVEVWGIPAKTGGSRTFCDRMNSWAQGEGQAGLGYIFFREGEGAGPVAKNIGPERTEQILTQFGLEDGDAIFFCAGVPKDFMSFAGAARNKLGHDLELIDADQFAFCWIVDFPLYEFDEQAQKIDFSHNPFSMPQGEMEALETMDPLDVLGYQYDIVCNGIELSSGAIRNHKPEIMLKAFEIAGYDAEVVEKEFGGMLNAFRFGAPPHGGIAPGVDRIVMLLAEQENLREVVAFPMNQQAEDLLMQAPSPATNAQLLELGLRVIETKKD
ncbi:MAG: aspartate--tRNA ligase [PS1 clade bacterium]|uniref:Aspartate--tRNA(Asp/Asn) ligase n=1 Tax=PS1 clade bacterium TaxID=2175152 RepID=A0A368E3V9_9PROT|nr:MAG: aspartate--tRNA ligase [PS1 clade bacterium]